MRASSLPLLTRCPGSLSLPIYDPRSDKNREATDWGQMVHVWKETGKIVGPDKRIENAFRKALKLSGADRDTLWPAGGVHEMSLALTVDDRSVVVVGDEAEKLQGRPGWITGHSDFYYRFLDGTLHIDDLKTSRLYPNPEPQWPGHVQGLDVGENRFPELPTSTQLRLYALATAEHLGHRGAVHCSITHWPRLPLTARHAAPIRYWHAYAYSELQDFWVRLRQIEEDRVHNDRCLTSPDPTGSLQTLRLNPGPQCRFCPSQVFCPEALTLEALNALNS